VTLDKPERAYAYEIGVTQKEILILLLYRPGSGLVSLTDYCAGFVPDIEPHRVYELLKHLKHFGFVEFVLDENEGTSFVLTEQGDEIERAAVRLWEAS
jgi:hypothetical protein